MIPGPAARAALVDCVIGLGSNLGDRRSNLSAAVRALSRSGSVLAVSPLYETVPVGPPQPEYLNAAVRLSTELGPRELLGRLLSIERATGRERRERWGPRTLDLDLLWASGVVVAEQGLTVPHPELLRRAFALVPLLDVAPDARDPASHELYSEVAERLDRTGVRELPETRSIWW
jgi:2-amino-4-hydroxy-6-hydroxymethyldihydropteridine diphosphokinase